jgi:hypothetical protein
VPRPAAAVLVALALPGCVATSPAIEQSSSTMTAIGVLPAERAYIGLLDLEPVDEPMTLTGLELPGRPADLRMTPLVLDAAKAGGRIGALREGEIPSGDAFSALAVPLEGYVVGPDVQPGQVIVRVWSAAPGTFELTRVRLTLKVGDRMATQEFPHGLKLCVGDPRPACHLRTG